MQKVLLFTLILLILMAPAPVQAQDDLRFESVLVHLWPEFDRRAMLVMYEIRLADTVSLPREVVLRIPAGADIVRVAVGESEERLRPVEFAAVGDPDGEWQQVTLRMASGRSLRLDYYDILELDGIQRQYVFLWPGVIPADRLRVVFQQPVDALKVNITPAPNSTSMDGNRLMYHRIELPASQLGGTSRVTVQYEKFTSRLSASLAGVVPENSLGSEAEGRITFAGTLTWLVGLAGFLLIFIGLAIGLSYLRGGGKRVILHWRPAGSHAENEDPVRALNCPECGNRMQPGDRFCRTCGLKLKPGD